MSHANNTEVAPIRPRQRARVTNDPLALGPSKNTALGRRYRDLVSGYAALIGPDRLARPDVRARLSALVSLQLMLEGLEAQVARGEAIDHSALVQGSQQLGKLLSELGLETPPPRDATPTLAQFLASKEDAA